MDQGSQPRVLTWATSQTLDSFSWMLGDSLSWVRVRSALGSNLGDLVFTVDRIFRSVFAFLPHGEAWRFLNRLPKINALCHWIFSNNKKRIGPRVCWKTYLANIGPFLRLFSWGNGRLGQHSHNSYFVVKKKTNRLTKQSNGEKLCIDLSGNTKYIFFFERKQNKKISWTSAVLRFMKHSLYFFERFFAIRKGWFRVLFSVMRNALYIYIYDFIIEKDQPMEKDHPWVFASSIFSRYLFRSDVLPLN